MMKKKHISNIVLLSIVTIIVLVSACSSSNGTASHTKDTTKPDGSLPTLQINDMWIQETTIDQEQYTLKAQVIGEEVINNKSCYKIQGTVDPPILGTSKNSLLYLGKATMDIVQREFTDTINGHPYTVVTTYSYTHSSTPYPYEVGKEWQTSKVAYTTITSMGESETNTEKTITNSKVERTETITVTAGTFECFVITTYDEQMNAISTSWSSADTKHTSVKNIDHETGAISELISYDLSL